MRLLDRLRREIAAWGKTEGIGWIFVLKATIAALLAMGISMRLELGQPVTAMVTVYIVMHPQTGMVLTKSFYRICGTFAGALASLTLLGLFAQERVLFLCGLALWIGVCTAGAALYRNFKSYGFTLAGYTAAMISLPLVMQPTGFFQYAVNRVTEVVVGLICAGVVSEVVFPESLGHGIMRSMEARYVQFTGVVRDVLSGNMAPLEIDRIHLQLAGNVVNFESLRSSLFMEASELRTRDLRLRRLNRDYMAISTTLHSLCRLLDRLNKSSPPAARALAPLRASLAEALAPEGSAGGAANARHHMQLLARFRAGLHERGEAIRHQFGGGSGSNVDLDIETGIELVRRFVGEMHDYMRTYALLKEKPGPEPADDIRFPSRTDPAVALLTGARAAAVTLLAAAFWIASAWPYGASAVMMAAITCALFAPAADPVLASKMGLFGVIIGFAAAFLCKFFVLTSLNGIWLLVVGMAPFLLLGTYLSLNPKLAVTGLGYSTMFCFMVSPANRMQYDPVQFINFGSALALGVAAGVAVFGTFAPVTGAWAKRRTARMLRREVEIACCCRLARPGSGFESGTPDLLQRIAARPDLQDPHTREILDWLLVVLEIGQGVIHLRQDAASIDVPQPLSSAIRDALMRVAGLFGRPNAENRDAALQSIQQAMTIILSESGREGICERRGEVLRRMLTSLHFIRSALLDEESILAATTARPPATIQGEAYAA